MSWQHKHFFFLPCRVLRSKQISGDTELSSSLLFWKRPCLKVTGSWESIPQKYHDKIVLTLYLARDVCCWGGILWSIHSWADVAQLLLCICGLKKLSVKWQQHSGFALHECLHLLAVVCCRSGPVRVLISNWSDTLCLVVLKDQNPIFPIQWCRRTAEYGHMFPF